MSRVSHIRQHLGDLDALLLTDPISIRYASGFYTEGAAIIAPDGAWLITDSRYIEAARGAISDMEVLCVSREKPLLAVLRELLAPCSAIGAEANRLSHTQWRSYEEELAVTLRPAGNILADLRAVKDAAEIELATKAQRIAEKALDEVLGMLDRKSVV
mgnify:CR=1 FL=1